MTLLPRTGIDAPQLDSRGRSKSGRPAPARGDASTRRWAATGDLADLPAWTDLRLDESIGHRVAIVPDAATLDDHDFERRTTQAYEELLDGVAADRILRAWNFIPRINEDAGCEPAGPCDRYMRFNAGRYRGFQRRYDEVPGYPVASGVGHSGDDLVVHLLHGDAELRLIDNPRQIRPESYSGRFGDPPPVFARAAMVKRPDDEWLLVSGTASVVGEASLHDDSFEDQLNETFRNLEVVVTAGWSDATPAELQDWLVYLPDLERMGEVVDAVARRWPGRRPDLVFREQRLCRPELQVEIECAGFRETASS